MRALIFALGVALAFPAGAAWQATRSPQPRLMGVGCDGAGGVLFADEESAFPACQDIHAANAETWGAR
jgi:hypothetical protein